MTGYFGYLIEHFLLDRKSEKMWVNREMFSPGAGILKSLMLLSISVLVIGSRCAFSKLPEPFFFSILSIKTASSECFPSFCFHFLLSTNLHFLPPWTLAEDTEP